MGRGAEEECVNGRGHGISEEGGGKKRWRTGKQTISESVGRGQRRKALMAGVGYFGGVGGGQEMLEDRGRQFRRTYDMHFEGHEAG